MTVRVGVVGLGFMGRTHLRAYAAAAASGDPCAVVAVCDPRLGDARRAGPAVRGNLERGGEGPLYDPAATARCADPDGLFARADVDLVSICTPTDTHVDLARRALAAGKHVLVEKPVALDEAGVRALIAARDRAGRLCVPAMCVRWWPAYAWLRRRVRDGSLGRVRSAIFTRLGSRPAWSDFYADASRSGGALFDLHVHDADLVAHLFGPPRAVTSAGTDDHVATVYHYDAGPPLAVAEGGWLAGALPFRMRYLVEFDRAVADFDLARDPPLLLCDASGPRPIGLAPGTGYEAEVRAMVRAAAGDASGLLATLEDALLTTRLLLAERESLRAARTVAFTPP